MIFGHYIEDINQEPLSIGNLVYPGKLMGLTSYGEVIEEWVPHFTEFYKSGPNGNTYEELLNELGNNIGVTFDVSKRLSGKLSCDISKTSQHVFEQCFFEISDKYVEKYPDLPICVTGGCGLNIILNTKIKERYGVEVFVGPNPNDCGLSSGMLLDQIKPSSPIDLTYSGTELLDKNLIPRKIENFPTHLQVQDLDLEDIVDFLIQGDIMGVVRGRSEHGPRALGNRSIICNPLIEGMKDTLNHKVKNREYFRPFSPIVRLEDVSEYFNWEGESRWMSFCPTVREEYREKIPSVVHVDGTCRVQTVTREQNELMYSLLTRFKEKTGIGVLLNTSFNVSGKPIVSSVEDCFEVLEKTEMDSLLIEELFIRKR